MNGCEYNRIVCVSTFTGCNAVKVAAVAVVEPAAAYKHCVTYMHMHMCVLSMLEVCGEYVCMGVIV